MAEIIDADRLLDALQGFEPLPRVLMATAGTLQGTLSAYFGAPVTVEVTDQVETEDGLRRDVNLVCQQRGEVVCSATTTVTVTDPELAALVEERRIGLGHMLALSKTDARFELDRVGVGEGCFWRRYRLWGDGFTFDITETFPAHLYQGNGGG